MDAVLSFSPSNAHRWLHCPGQPLAVRDLPDRPSKYAERGTVAHHLMELAIKLDLGEQQLEKWIGQRLLGAPPHAVDEAMVRGVGHTLDYLRSYLARFPAARYHSECGLKIRLGKYETGGTADLVIDALPTELVIADYKHGVNVVEEEENPQLMLYGIGYLQENNYWPVLEDTRVRTTIIQPNAQDGRPPVREAIISHKALTLFHKGAVAAVQKVHAPDPERNAGGHCRFCRAAGVCRTYAQQMLAQAGVEFGAAPEEIAAMDANDLTPEELARVLESINALRAWIISVEEHAIETMMHDGTIPGFKVVGSRPQRKWDSEKEVLRLIPKALLDKLAPRSPLSPAQMEKQQRGAAWNPFFKHITHNPIEPRVAPLSDNRPPYIPGQEFKE